MQIGKYNLHDHKLSSEKPLEIQYFGRNDPIPLSIIDMHPTLHLGVVLGGTLRFWIDGCERELSAGQCWLIAPLEPHTSLAHSPDREAIVATFLEEEFGRGFAGWNLPFMTPLSVAVPERHRILDSEPHPEILRLARELRGLTLDSAHPYRAFAQWLLLHRLYVEILRLFRDVPIDSRASAGLERLRPALLLQRMNPGRSLPLGEAAAACHLSQGRFSELFRKYMGASFSQYEIRCRLSGARNEVLAGTRSFKEIASEWGFYDESHFLRIFRKIYGCTPGDYRKKM